MGNLDKSGISFAIALYQTANDIMFDRKQSRATGNCYRFQTVNFNFKSDLANALSGLLAHIAGVLSFFASILKWGRLKGGHTAAGNVHYPLPVSPRI